MSQNSSKTTIFTKKNVSDTDYGLKTNIYFIVLVKNICT